MDVSTLPAECKDGCIYSKMGLGNNFVADREDGGDLLFDEGGGRDGGWVSLICLRF